MKEYNHYYKKVPEGVEYIDVYRVLEMFDVTNPSIAHAVKKLLVAGGRGHKDIKKDIKEAIVSLSRWVEMREEEQVLQHANKSDIGPKCCDVTQNVYFGSNCPKG